jgi:xylulokinase
MEGVAFSLRDCLQIMNGLGVDPAEIRATGGGARSGLWRQILADILGCRIARTVNDQGPAFGAALLGGVAAGSYSNVEEACSVIELRPDANEPDPPRVRMYEDYYAVYQSLYPSTRAAMDTLAALADS